LGPSLAEMLRTEIGQSAHLRSISGDRIGQIQRDLHIAPDADLDSGALRRLAEFSNAETILWGQYAKLGDAIRIDARLEDVAHQRATPFKVEAPSQSGVFAAVEQLAQAIRQNLALPPDILKELEQKSFKPSTQSLDALRHYNEGLQFARQGKHSDARKAFQAATDSDKDFALAYSRLGQSYANLGYDDEAERASRRAVDLSGTLPPQERYLVQANHARIVNDNAKAIESYTNLARVSPEDPDVHFNLASLYEAVGSFDLARTHYEKVLAGDPNNVEALFAQGRVEIQRRNPQGALDYLTRALTLAVQVENDESKANVLNAIGVAYKRLNKPDEALRYYQQSMDIKRARGDKRGLGLTLGEMAQVQASLGKTDRALADYTEALRLNREIGYKKGIGTTLINFGRFHADRAHYDQALALFKEALQIERELGDQNYQALCLDNIGGIYTFKGEFEDARTYFERALELREALKVPGNIADTLHNLAETSTRVGNYDEALKQYLRALQLRRDAGDKRGAAIESYSLGTVFEQQGAYGAAIKSKEEALKTFRDLHDRSFWLAEILGGYGHALGFAGRNADAEAALAEGLAVAREIHNQGLIAQTLNFLGDNALFRGDAGAARGLFEQALKESGPTGDRYLVLLSTANAAHAALRDRQRPSGRGAADADAKKATDALTDVGREADRRGFKYLALECTIDVADAQIASGSDVVLPRGGPAGIPRARGARAVPAFQSEPPRAPGRAVRARPSRTRSARPRRRSCIRARGT
ncbi:MAG TPA: tetratricopeptide repeat protein, partial [Vicinamibacterales bacterium]